MAALTNGNTIDTQSTTYYLTLVPGLEYAFMASGTFGGGTITATMVNSGGAEVVIPTYGAITAATAFCFRAAGETLKLAIGAATNPSVKISCIPCRA